MRSFAVEPSCSFEPELMSNGRFRLSACTRTWLRPSPRSYSTKLHAIFDGSAPFEQAVAVHARAAQESRVGQPLHDVRDARLRIGIDRGLDGQVEPVERVQVGKMQQPDQAVADLLGRFALHVGAPGEPRIGGGGSVRKCSSALSAASRSAGLITPALASAYR